MRRYFVSKRRVRGPVLEKNYHANARMATVGLLIAVSYWPRFSSPGSDVRRPVISITTRGTAGGGSCQSRTLSTGCSHAGTATKSRTYSVLKRRHLATCCTARLWVENFVGGKFRDLLMSHENNENWHPTKITRYTEVFIPSKQASTWRQKVT